MNLATRTQEVCTDATSVAEGWVVVGFVGVLGLMVVGVAWAWAWRMRGHKPTT